MIKWIKISTNIFDDEKITLIEELPESDSILVIWFKLLVLAGRKNDSGLIYITKDIPYDTDKLARVMRREKKLVDLAMQTFEKLGMIEMLDDSSIFVLNWEKHQNIEGMEKIREQNRIRQQKHRDKMRNVTSRDSNALDKTRLEENRIYKEVVNYLNEKASTNYRHSSKATKDKIKARLNERFTVQDFKKVIDVKVDDWINDKKMKKFLRPETLFGTKFESYLNEYPSSPQNVDVCPNCGVALVDKKCAYCGGKE